MTTQPFFMRSTLEFFKLLPTEEITLFQSDRNYTHIYFVNGLKVTFSKTLQLLETQLPPESFMRINRGVTVNVLFITHFDPKLKVIRLTNDLIVPISRRRYGHIKRWWRGQNNFTL